MDDDQFHINFYEPRVLDFIMVRGLPSVLQDEVQSKLDDGYVLHGVVMQHPVDDSGTYIYIQPMIKLAELEEMEKL